MITEYVKVDFWLLREYNLDYATQREVPQDQVRMFMACKRNVIRRGKCTGYHNVKRMIERMQGVVDDGLLTHFARVMILGAPNYFVTESSQKNALLH